MKANALRELSGEQLRQQMAKREKDLVVYRLQMATEVVENVRASREARREIARIKTVLRERELAAEKRNQ